MNLEDYLLQKHTPATVKNYLFEINHLLDYLGESRAEQATYQDLQQYLQYLRTRYDNPNTITRILQAIKQYYYYLNAIEKRSDHPCRYIRLRDRYDAEIQIQDLLSEEELSWLLKRKERYAILKNRNQVVMSLLVHQALLPKEMAQLEVGNIDLATATIYIRPTPKTNARTLNLVPQQILLFQDYLTITRPQLLKTPTEKLILTKRGTEEKGEGIHYLCETYRHLFPTKRLTPTTIRQSVIANLLKQGKDLRVVQVFAGHKKVSATERYRQNNLEALQQAIQKFHPIK